MNHEGNSGNGPVLVAAARALKTGNVQYILEWIPEAHENKMKNLFEKTLCDKRIGKDRQGSTVDWYYKTACQLHDSADRTQNDCRK